MTQDRPATVVYIATSLDGFIARSDGGLDWLGSPDAEMMERWTAFLASVDHLVMGRKTFETVLGFGGEWPYEGTPVTVLSRTLEGVPESLRGKADISDLEPTALLARLQDLGRSRVYLDGGQVIQSFLRGDLVDELILTTIPILLGDGIRLFGGLDGDLTWEHAGTETFPAGLVQTCYRRQRL